MKMMPTGFEFAVLSKLTEKITDLYPNNRFFISYIGDWEVKITTEDYNISDIDLIRVRAYALGWMSGVRLSLENFQLRSEY